jgi:hypothetical protein
MARRVLTIMVGLLAVETLLAVVGVDLRGVPDALAGGALLVSLSGVLAVLVRAGQRRGGYAAWWTWIIAAAVAVIVPGVFAAVGDWKTWLALVAFLVCAVALVIFLGFTLSTLVALVRRRWRGARPACGRGRARGCARCGGGERGVVAHSGPAGRPVHVRELGAAR